MFVETCSLIRGYNELTLDSPVLGGSLKSIELELFVAIWLYPVLPDPSGHSKCRKMSYLYLYDGFLGYR